MELMLEDLYQSYSKTPVLCGLSETFTEGKIYSIIGRNGAGKTTLFNCISGNLRYKSGKILLTDQGVLRPIEFKDVGMVSASPMLPEYLTGYEFIHYFLKMRADSEIQSEKESYFFDLVKISNKDRHNLIKNYSYGMQNKIQLLCCLIRNPKILLLDEPLSSFDIIVSHDIRQVLIELKSNHIILMATHLLQLAVDISDEIYLLKNGAIIHPPFDSITNSGFEPYIMEALKDEA